MSRRDDTVSLISDDSEGAVAVTVYSATMDYEQRPAVEGVSATVSVSTVMFFPYRASSVREGKGVISQATDLIIFPWTSTVSTMQRIRKDSAPTAYYEILVIDVFEDHKEVYAKKVENR